MSCPATVERREGTLSRSDFIKEFVETNTPVLITGLCEEWKAFRRWRLAATGEPDFKALIKDFGDSDLPVTRTKKIPGSANDASCILSHAGRCTSRNIRMKGSTFFRLWQKHSALGRGGCDVAGTRCGEDLSHARYALTGDGVLEGVTELPLPSPEAAKEDLGPYAAEDFSEFYAKNWHLARDYPNYRAYKCPDCFSGDWLNAYWDSEGSDDYRFVYAGPSGTSTPLHHDVLRSHSWSSNITGKKLWILFPPEATPMLTDERGELIPDASRDGVAEASRELRIGAGGRAAPDGRLRWPRVLEAWSMRYEIIQRAGETLFVPSGWHHQVTNLGDTISINHNWFGAPTAKRVWRFLKMEKGKIADEIRDCKNMFQSDARWNEHVQILLRANCGMDYSQWRKLLAQQVNGRGSEEEKNIALALTRELDAEEHNVNK